jgi:hypothetical protein
MISNVVLYNIVEEFPLSFNNVVSETIYPEKTHPDLKYFVPYEPYEIKNYDQRLEDYKRIKTPVETSHPLYPIYGQWLIEHEYTKRSQTDVFMSIENARRVANATWIDIDLYSMCLGIVVKKINNELLTIEENVILSESVNVHIKLMQNYQNEINLKNAWLDNQNINIDEGWEKKS